MCDMCSPALDILSRICYIENLLTIKKFTKKKNQNSPNKYLVWDRHPWVLPCHINSVQSEGVLSLRVGRLVVWIIMNQRWWGNSSWVLCHFFYKWDIMSTQIGVGGIPMKEDHKPCPWGLLFFPGTLWWSFMKRQA